MLFSPFQGRLTILDIPIQIFFYSVDFPHLPPIGVLPRLWNAVSVKICW